MEYIKVMTGRCVCRCAGFYFAWVMGFGQAFAKNILIFLMF